MKKELFLIAFCFVALGLFSQTFNWAKGFGSPRADNPWQVLPDQFGNVYTVGRFVGLTDFDPGPGVFNLTPPNNTGGPFVPSDGFVSKLDANGNFLWGRQIGGPGNDDAFGLCFDFSGNAYVVGIFRGTADFDPGPGTYTLTTSGDGGYICKLDPSGNFIWAKSLDTPIRSIKIDPLGNICISGNFMNTVDFDPGPATYALGSANTNGSFACKLDASGNFIWARDISSAYINNSCLSIDNTGDIYLAGNFTGAGDFDPSNGTFNLTSAFANDIYIVKMTASGNFTWAKRLDAEAVTSLDCDASGSIIMTGNFSGTTDFDPGPTVLNFNANANPDIFILKLDANANFLWAKQIGTQASEQGYSTVSVTGDIYVTGYFAGLMDVDPGTNVFNLTSVGASDAFVLKLDPSGNFVWAKNFGGNASGNMVLGTTLATDATNLYISGGYDTQGADFDPGPGQTNLTNVSTLDVFVCKYGICDVPALVLSGSPYNGCNGVAPTLSVSSQSNINWYASSTSTLPLASGYQFTAPALALGTYTYYAQATSCGTVSSSVPITVTVFPLPVVTASTQSYLICRDQSATINPGGALTYSLFGPYTSGFVAYPIVTSSYTLTGTDLNTCTNSAVITITVTDCTGINHTSSSVPLVTVFPNPATDVLHVSLSSYTNERLKYVGVYNLLGELVLEQELVVNNDIATINTGNLKKGVYLLKIKGSERDKNSVNETITCKFMVDF